MERCNLCDQKRDLIDGLCNLCNPESHDYEANLEAELKDQELWKE